MIMQRLSLLARGTLTHHIRVRPRDRFIPAGAGNTTMTHPTAIPTAVYPRWRGEHCDPAGPGTITTGLSPLARGTRANNGCRCVIPRFIPAGAGNTHSCARISPVVPVYPRWRGEHSSIIPRHLYRRGLSPLARGTLVHHSAPPIQARFIPAGAGNTVAT